MLSFLAGKWKDLILLFSVITFATTYIIYQTNYTNSSDYAYVYAKVEVASADIVQETTYKSNDFVCQIKNGKDKKLSNSFNCEVSKLKENDLKQHNAGKIPESEVEHPTGKDLSTNSKFFQIKFDGKHWNKLTNTNDDIQIIPTSKPYDQNKNISLEISLALYKDDKMVDNPSFIVRAKNNGTVNLNDQVIIKGEVAAGSGHEKEFKCSFNENEKPTKTCHIGSFTEHTGDQTNYADLPFKKGNVNQKTLVEKDKHYLIQFTKEEPMNLKDFKHKIIYAEMENKKEAFYIVSPSFISDFYEHILVID